MYIYTTIANSMVAWLINLAVRTLAVAQAVDLNWHPPESTRINNLDKVLHSNGVYGFIFDSSQTPDHLYGLYGTCNWCNMPHVRRREYPRVGSNYQLLYVEVLHRHHKRTPYASNLFPFEDLHSWICDSGPGNSSCSFPKITSEGLIDSQQHGIDLYNVYHNLLGFLPARYSSSSMEFRVTNNPITGQVVKALLTGMFGVQASKDIPITIQPQGIDSLEPQYPCAAASNLSSIIRSGKNWTEHLNVTKGLFSSLDGVSGVKSTDQGWHSSYDHYFDNLSAKLCHQKGLPCKSTQRRGDEERDSDCVTRDQANEVFRLGQYEYSYIYRDSPLSLPQAAASYGVWMGELATHIRARLNGTSSVKYRHNVAHDGSVSRLLALLQIEKMVWPGMGSELVFEVYERKSYRRNKTEHFLRILWGGQLLRSSHPNIGRAEMIPSKVFLSYIDGLVGLRSCDG